MQALLIFSRTFVEVVRAGVGTTVTLSDAPAVANDASRAASGVDVESIGGPCRSGARRQ